MKRTLEDIRENLDYSYCDNETVLELCAEVERLREYRDHHEFVLSQIEAATRVKISTIGDVLAEIKGLNAVVAKLTRDCNSLEDDVRYNGEALARSDEMKGEIERLRAEIRDGDYWQQRASAALENGTCPICFATDEAGHTATCPWGEDERDSDRLQDEVNELKRLVARADEAFRKYRKMMAAAEKARKP